MGLLAIAEKSKSDKQEDREKKPLVHHLSRRKKKAKATDLRNWMRIFWDEDGFESWLGDLLVSRTVE
jgi:hypothetical protein